MVLIVVLGSKRHDLNVHSAILLEVSRSCRFCNLTPNKYSLSLQQSLENQTLKHMHVCCQSYNARMLVQKLSALNRMQR